MNFYEQLARFKKVIENGVHLPINDKAKVALMNAYDNQAAAKNIVNLFSIPKARRELQNIMLNKPWWERMYHKLDPYTHLNAQYSILAKNNSPAIRKYRADLDDVDRAVRHYNKQVDDVFNIIADKAVNSIGKNPTRRRLLEVGEEVPGVPWWGAIEVPNPNLVANAKEFQNLPKYLRKAYDAGHSVNPSGEYNMKSIVAKNFNR